MGPYANYMNVPGCCKNCTKLWSEAADEYLPNFYYCEYNLMLPTKRQTCARRVSDHKPPIFNPTGKSE